ncbi:MAG: 3-oxoacyl-ACP reductase FabG [Acidobacteria bacterium]|nr:3-oxoacyl-ACP reductase FabG [Acidobacteriota bacterium]
MSGRLDGKIALVTGGSRGIGRAICLRFAREGAAVIVNYTKGAEAAAQVVANIKKDGGKAMAIQADVANKGQVRAMADRALAEFGRVDILINNAGILTRGTTLNLDEDELDRMMDVNLKGVINVTQAVAPHMIRNRYGKIVNLSSLAGLGTAVGETTPYALTKAAVILLTKRMALEFGPSGINVNAIAPGFVKTEMLDGVDVETPGRKAMMGRVGTPEDIANAALFLASDEAGFITAQVLTVDGGRTDFLSASA